MDPQLGKKVCYVQFPQRFDGIDRSDRYANHNTVFFDVSNRVVFYLYFSWVIALWVLNVGQFVYGTPKATGITGIGVCTRWSWGRPNFGSACDHGHGVKMDSFPLFFSPWYPLGITQVSQEKKWCGTFWTTECSQAPQVLMLGKHSSKYTTNLSEVVMIATIAYLWNALLCFEVHRSI
jgi:hypothetical protein